MLGCLQLLTTIEDKILQKNTKDRIQISLEIMQMPAAITSV